MKDEFDRLVSEYFDGELDSSGQRRLVELAESDASKMEMLRDMLRQDRLLNFEHNAVAPENFVSSVMDSICADSEGFVSGVTEDIFTMNKRRKWLRVLALAASVMLVAGGLTWRFYGGGELPPEGKFLMAEIAGDVKINGQAISDADGIYDHGASIETGERSSARLLLYDASELRIDENTHMISRDDRNVFIENGSLLSRITPRSKDQKNFLVAASGNRSVTVMGTLFKTMVIDDFMNVVVMEGTVRVGSGDFHESVSAAQKIVIIKDCLMPVRSVSDYAAGDSRNRTLDDEGLPYVALDEYKNGKILASDGFDDGLKFWKPYRFVKADDKDLIPENINKNELPDELQIKDVKRNGKRSNALVLRFNDNEQHGVLIDYAELPAAYSLEYDLYPAKASSLDCFILEKQWKESVSLLDADKSIDNGKVRSRNKLHKCRAEYVEHIDKQGRPSVEGRLWLDGMLVFHVMHFAEGYYPGVVATHGVIKIDNVVLREMVR